MAATFPCGCSEYACFLIISSIWLILAAVHQRWKQLNVKATVVDQHQLITAGPYAIVRHRIYAGMLGLMLSTGIATSHWYIPVVAGAFELAGMQVRIRQEEQLLIKVFGREYEVYRDRVPAFIPWFRSSGRTP